MSEASEMDSAPTRRTAGELVGPRAARVVGHTVQRFKPDGSYDWFTVHLTKRGARRAARIYEQTGEVKGVRP